MGLLYAIDREDEDRFGWLEHIEGQYRLDNQEKNRLWNLLGRHYNTLVADFERYI